jgi:hypothetical protein
VPDFCNPNDQGDSLVFLVASGEINKSPPAVKRNSWIFSAHAALEKQRARGFGGLAEIYIPSLVSWKCRAFGIVDHV